MSAEATVVHEKAAITAVVCEEPGFVPDGFLAQLIPYPTHAMAELVATRTWERGSDGYEINDDATTRRAFRHVANRRRRRTVCARRGHRPDLGMPVFYLAAVSSVGGAWHLCADCLAIVGPGGRDINTGHAP